MVLPKIVYQGEITLAENDNKGIFKDFASFENSLPEKSKFLEKEGNNLEIFQQNHFPSDLLINDFFKSQENFTKMFKTKLKGYFFASQIKVILFILLNFNKINF